MESEDYDIKQKVLILGANGVGKSTITSVAHSRKDEILTYATTIGIEYGIYYGFTNNGKKMKLSIWDASGDQRFASIVRSYLCNTDACLLVYDVNDLRTLEELDFWMKLIDTCYQFQVIKENNLNYSNYPPIYLIGTKTDLIDSKGIYNYNNNIKSVQKEDIDEFLEKHNLPQSSSYQINATKFTDVNRIFVTLVNHLYYKNIERISIINNQDKTKYSSLGKDSDSVDMNQSNSCCIIL